MSGGTGKTAAAYAIAIALLALWAGWQGLRVRQTTAEVEQVTRVVTSLEKARKMETTGNPGSDDPAADDRDADEDATHNDENGPTSAYAWLGATVSEAERALFTEMIQRGMFGKRGFYGSKENRPAQIRFTGVLDNKAIVNGLLVQVGDVVQEAKVIAIAPTRLTLRTVDGVSSLPLFLDLSSPNPVSRYHGSPSSSSSEKTSEADQKRLEWLRQMRERREEQAHQKPSKNYSSGRSNSSYNKSNNSKKYGSE